MGRGMNLERLSSVPKVAKFLGTAEDTVTQLLEEGRLGGSIIAAIRLRGVAVTPNVKNSVEAVVRTMAPGLGAPAVGLEGSHFLASEATATIMFTDIVESTAMTERLGDRDARELVRRHNEIIRPHAKAYGGTEVKCTGDGFMLTFPSARGGVACAVAVQRELARYNSEHPEAQLGVRIGLSVGEPIHEEEDLFGSSVNFAARISAKAERGQVLVSHIVHALVANAGEFIIREVGGLELEGFSGNHLIYEVEWRQS